MTTCEPVIFSPHQLGPQRCGPLSFRPVIMPAPELETELDPELELEPEHDQNPLPTDNPPKNALHTGVSNPSPLRRTRRVVKQANIRTSLANSRAIQALPFRSQSRTQSPLFRCHWQRGP